MMTRKLLLVTALLAALPVAAQLHKCKDKAGKTVYQDSPCEAGTDAGKVTGVPEAAAGGAQPAPAKAAALGLWEVTMVMRPRQKTLSREELELAGANGFFLGRPMKTVSCTQDPAREWMIDSYCEKQVAAGGGTCRRVDTLNQAPWNQEKVHVITGDFRTHFRIETTVTNQHQSEPATRMVDESTFDYRYLGACKPGMPKGTTFHVNARGEWVTEAQISAELDAAARAADKRKNK